MSLLLTQHRRFVHVLTCSGFPGPAPALSCSHENLLKSRTEPTSNWGQKLTQMCSSKKTQGFGKNSTLKWWWKAAKEGILCCCGYWAHLTPVQGIGLIWSTVMLHTQVPAELLISLPLGASHGRSHDRAQPLSQKWWDQQYSSSEAIITIDAHGSHSAVRTSG